MPYQSVALCHMNHPPHQTLHTGELCHHRTQLKCCSIYSENKHIFIKAVKRLIFLVTLIEQLIILITVLMHVLIGCL